MKVDNFRELLVKKAEGDETLQTLVKFIDKGVLAEKVIESLEKMARSSHKGDTANLALRDFASDMDPELEPHMLRDALGHHVSRYGAALKAGNKSLANKHARQAFNLMNMADRAQKHSQGKLSFEHVSPHAWERNKVNATYDEDHPKVKEGKYRPGAFKTKTKGLNYKGTDFSHLQSAPHESFKREIKRHGHNKAYPFNQIKVNGKHIVIEDVDPSELKDYEEHPFDHHPVMEHYSVSSKNRTADQDKSYFEAKNKYYNESPHIDSFFDRHEKLEQLDPLGYQKRGLEPSKPVHPEIEGLSLEDIAKPAAAPTAGATTGMPGQKQQTAPAAAEQPVAAPKMNPKEIHPDVVNTIKQLNPELLDKLGLGGGGDNE